MGSTVAVGSTGFQHIRVVLFEDIDNFGLGFGFRGDFIPEPDCGCFDIGPFPHQGLKSVSFWFH